MNIALVTYALHVGGVETFLSSLADCFQANGHNVDIIETQEVGSASSSFSESGYHVTHLMPKTYRSRISHALFIAEHLKKYDVVLLNDAPFAQSIIGFLPDDAIVIPVLHLPMTSMLRNATANSTNWDAIVAVSPYLKQCILNYGIEEDRAFCIPNGVKVDDSWPKENHNFFSSLPLKVVFIGRIVHDQKGVLHLPGIIRKIMALGVDVRLEVIGDGPDMEQLQQSIETDNLHSYVTFHGQMKKSEVLAILKQSDVLLMPSYFEGFGLVLLEAMAAGVVPVASFLRGVTDSIVDDKKNGSLVIPGDEDDFAQAIAFLSKNRKLLQTLSFAGWEKVSRTFSYEKTGLAYLELAARYRELRIKGRMPHRNGNIDETLLGDFPLLPVCLVRPVRKLLGMLGRFPRSTHEPSSDMPFCK